MPFKLRPHHLICSLCFRGRGYDKAFVKSFEAICQALHANPDSEIVVTSDCDDVCAKCPQKQSHCCRHEKKVAAMDQAYLTMLQLKVGQVITLQALKIKIKTLLTMTGFHQACGQCSWYDLNLCAPILKTLL
jgi:uncharacterized protein